jgi:hypothetical protein
VHHGFPSPFLATSLAASLVAAALLGACASTTRVTLTPPAQEPVCQSQAAVKAAVLWRTRWRADQKDVTEREAAAGQGITRFFAEAGCFASVGVARTEAGGSAFDVPAGADRLVVLTVRELGPTVRLLSSAALVEGGTEAVVDVAVYRPGQREPQQQFSIHWQDGGPGVVKGVQTLPADMAAALKAGLQAR